MDSNSAQPGTRGRGLVLALLAASHFILILDSAIVGVALPSIGRDLGFAAQDLSWIPNAYTLLYGGFLVLGGRLGDYLGRRRLFTGGLVLFAAASLTGSLAPSPGWLIAARALQGFAAAVIAPAALSLVLTVFPDTSEHGAAARNRALAVMGTMAAAGGSVGLFAGGVLTDLLGWQSVFYVNVPVALAGALLGLRLLPADPRADRSGRFDLTGAITITAGLTLLVFVLVNAGTAGWTAGRTAAWGTLSVALIAAFLLVQARSSNPLIPLRVFRRRSLRGANAVAALINMAVSPIYIVLSLYLQQVLHFSAFRSGVAVVPLAVTSTLVSTMSGRLINRFGVRTCCTTGLVFFGIGVAWMSRISGGSYPDEILGPLLLLGAGGVVFVAFTVAATAGADEDEAGLASGVLGTSTQIGAAVGLAVLTNVATRATRSAAAQHAITTGNLTTGYRDALLAATGFMVLAVAVSLTMLPGRRSIPATAVAQADPETAQDPHRGQRLRGSGHRSKG